MCSISVCSYPSLSSLGSVEHVLANHLAGTIRTNDCQAVVLRTILSVNRTVGDCYDLAGICIGTSLFKVLNELSLSVPNGSIIKRIRTVTMIESQCVKRVLGHLRQIGISSHLLTLLSYSVTLKVIAAAVG